MAEKSAITWTDATFNPWMGCTKVGPGCDHCYAEKLVDDRFHRAKWGAGEPRSRTSESNWSQVRRWNAHPEKLIGSQWPGRKPRVFAASLADIFDNEIDPTWRADFWALVKAAPNLQWLIVTKRIGNVPDMLPPDWGPDYAHVVLLITVVNQPEVDRDCPKLSSFGAEHPWLKLGLSIEPMLARIDLDRGGFTFLRDLKSPAGKKYAGVDWVICGGESGAGARPMHPDWVRLLRDQCAAYGVPFHFKQWGEWVPLWPSEGDWPTDGEGCIRLDFDGARTDIGMPMQKVGKVFAGRTIDYIEHDGFPA